jgi:hypothetical protein
MVDDVKRPKPKLRDENDDPVVATYRRSMFYPQKRLRTEHSTDYVS